MLLTIHACPFDYRPEALRFQEARRAVQMLGAPTVDCLLAGWPSASPPLFLRGPPCAPQVFVIPTGKPAGPPPERGPDVELDAPTEDALLAAACEAIAKRGQRARAHADRARRVRGGRAVTTPDAILAADERLRTILKAVVVGTRVQDPASRPADEDSASAFSSARAAAALRAETLCLLVEHSTSLRQNVDAYATNIDGFGYRFAAVIDFDAEDARTKVADAITLERLAARDAGTLPEGLPLTPSAEDVSSRFTELRQAARVERSRLDAFFDFACFDHSLSTCAAARSLNDSQLGCFGAFCMPRARV